MNNITFKRQPFIIRLWWKIINPIIRKRPTDLGGEDDFKSLMEGNNSDTQEVQNNGKKA